MIIAELKARQQSFFNVQPLLSLSSGAVIIFSRDYERLLYFVLFCVSQNLFEIYSVGKKSHAKKIMP